MSVPLSVKLLSQTGLLMLPLIWVWMEMQKTFWLVKDEVANEKICSGGEGNI